MLSKLVVSNLNVIKIKVNICIYNNLFIKMNIKDIWLLGILILKIINYIYNLNSL